jgi:hypothetical protein
MRIYLQCTQGQDICVLLQRRLAPAESVRILTTIAGDGTTLRVCCWSRC